MTLQEHAEAIDAEMDAGNSKPKFVVGTVILIYYIVVAAYYGLKICQMAHSPRGYLESQYDGEQYSSVSHSRMLRIVRKQARKHGASLTADEQEAMAVAVMDHFRQADESSVASACRECEGMPELAGSGEDEEG